MGWASKHRGPSMAFRRRNRLDAYPDNYLDDLIDMHIGKNDGDKISRKEVDDAVQRFLDEGGQIKKVRP